MKNISKKCNIVVNSWNLKNFSKQYEYYKFKFDPFDFSVEIDLDNYFNFEDLKTVFNDIKSTNLTLPFVEFRVKVKDNLFEKEEFENLKKLNNMLEFEGATLHFKQFNLLWNIDEAQKAYNLVYGIVDKIKDKNLSPLEQLLCVYKEATDRQYKKETQKENALLSRSIYGIANTDNIVCSGYSEIIKEVVCSLNDPNLICYCQSLNYKNKISQNTSGHRLNVIYIKDEKYDIEGFYNLDATSDSVSVNKDVMTLANFLTPIDDINLLTNYEIKVDADNPFLYFYNVNKNQTILSLTNLLIRNVLNKQNFVDMESSRENFKTKILQTYIDKEDFKTVDQMANLLSTVPFSSKNMEYNFLKHVCNKIKAKSKVIELDSFEKALDVICRNYLELDDTLAKEYVTNVMEFSKKYATRTYLKTAKNAFNIAGLDDLKDNQTRQEKINKYKELIKGKMLNKKKIKLNYQVVVAKINGEIKILVAEDFGLNKDENYLVAKDLNNNKYNLLWEINDRKFELYLNNNLLTPLCDYLNENNIKLIEKNTEITFGELKLIQEKITKINSLEK